MTILATFTTLKDSLTKKVNNLAHKMPEFQMIKERMTTMHTYSITYMGSRIFTTRECIIPRKMRSKSRSTSQEAK
jgi:hypothetical protein